MDDIDEVSINDYAKQITISNNFQKFINKMNYFIYLFIIINIVVVHTYDHDKDLSCDHGNKIYWWAWLIFFGLKFIHTLVKYFTYPEEGTILIDDMKVTYGSLMIFISISIILSFVQLYNSINNYYNNKYKDDDIECKEKNSNYMIGFIILFLIIFLFFIYCLHYYKYKTK